LIISKSVGVVFHEEVVLVWGRKRLISAEEVAALETGIER
jgi:hypothetical protein